jgi:hypothetical protein
MFFVVFFAGIMFFVVVHCWFSFTLKIHYNKKQLTRQRRHASTESVTIRLYGKTSIGGGWMEVGGDSSVRHI